MLFDSEHTDTAPVIAFARKKKIWLHVDVDVVDPSVMPAVVFPAPGGVTMNTLTDLIAQLVAVADVRGFDVCGYDPKGDETHRLPFALGEAFAAFAPKAMAV